MSAYAIVMGFLEAAVVVYLRAPYYPEGFELPLTRFLEPAMLGVERVRWEWCSGVRVCNNVFKEACAGKDMRKIRGVQKRGISPVIATMLLVSIALVLAVIIFLWARAVLTEKIQKDLGGGPELIESFCKDVNFEVEAFSEAVSPSYVKGRTSVRIVNRGNVPIHALEIRKKDATKQKIQLLGVGAFYKTTANNQPRRTIANGEDGEVSIDCAIPSAPPVDPCPVEKSATLTVVPIILGQKGTQYQDHVCDTEFAKETVVR